MLNFVFHPDFIKEIAGFKRRFPFFDSGLDSFQRICEVQFDPISPRQIIAPAKLHRIRSYNGFKIWEVELSVKGLRANQSPRVWFAVHGITVAFLCVATHVDNYNDNEMNKKSEIMAGLFF